MQLSDEKLRGRTVIAADGQAVGEVGSILVNSEGWRVEALVIKLRNEVSDQLGVTRSIFQAGSLELPVRMVQSVGDAILLSVPTLDLRQLLPRMSDPASA